jgi:hypothetical protein
MPTGQPDILSRAKMESEHLEPVAERIVREAIEAGEFDDLAGTGKPIPGRGTVDDELWWVRSWVERNREFRSQESASSE